MAITILVDKAALIRVGTGSSGARETLGYNKNDTQVDLNPIWIDVHGDQHGGEEGPPIDAQMLPPFPRIRLELTRVDNAIADKLRALVVGGTAGTYTDADIGSLQVTDSKAISVFIKSTNRPLSFPLCRVDVASYGKGTKHSSLIFEFEAFRNLTTGVIFSGST
jgi:hypothetical protein